MSDLNDAPPPPRKLTLWQRWMAWSGSFLVLSILFHIILIGGAALLIVQVVQGRKEKLKFTAAPPQPAAPAEHKVKPSKKSAAAPPAVAKRITSTAANVSIALPEVEMSSSTSLDMSSLMSGLGASGSGFGSGAGGMGAGVASMAMPGLTAFGFRGKTTNAGLIGHIYDLKQTPDGKPTDVKDDGALKDPHLLDKFADPSKSQFENGQAVLHQMQLIMKDQSPLGKRSDLLTQSVQTHAAVINEFIKDWDESILKRYYQSKDPMNAYQVFIPACTSQDALNAFGVEKEIKPSHFLIHYKGNVRALKSGTYRFRLAGLKGRNVCFIRFGGHNVFGYGGSPLIDMKDFTFKDVPTFRQLSSYYEYLPSTWFDVSAGEKYTMEILMDCETKDQGFWLTIMIEDKNPEKPYPVRFASATFVPNRPPAYVYPVFALMKGLKMPAYDKAAMLAQKPMPGHEATFTPVERIPEYLPDPMIFPPAK